MAFSDQARKMIGTDVCVETRKGTFTGRLVDVKRSTIIMRIDNRRSIIRIAEIIALLSLI
ncbi:DUF2642 domain-containing protein [Brevibacillus choshinensis]|uniref:DUF2642 domain-containing protein n=1 Tax=Brevibacillus choshinensis TaxID=54911 RepID=UPI002E1D5840|nr:DUF2642 domain-containing protein [Brevibacillus choshinensis]MED4753441.1 DUF2642 domain-containing protein [Brevibacillus choshinensis]MED4782129.1 DUF2642 domain-containing protein [Brevibacillus choshinensis]